MTAGAASVVAVLATAGIEAAKVAVLAVLGLMVAAAAAYFGVLKVAQLLGVIPASSAAGLASSPSAYDIQDREYSEAYADALAESDRDRLSESSWGHHWSDASGTGSADVDRWRY